MGSDEVQAAGRSVSTVISARLPEHDLHDVAKPCRMEKDDTEAVIEAKLMMSC